MASKLGVKIHKLRKDKGMTLEQLAKSAGLSKSYLWELENRETASPSAQKLQAIADILGVSPTYFMDDDTADAKEEHLDEAFFRGYKQLEPEAKDQLRKILDTFKKNT